MTRPKRAQNTRSCFRELGTAAMIVTFLRFSGHRIKRLGALPVRE